MITDALVDFNVSNLAILGVDIPTSPPFDVLGLGTGVTASQGAVIIGTRSVFGADMGIGGVLPLVECAVGTAFVTAAGAQLKTQFQGAVDDGTGNPGTWITLMETLNTAAQLTAGQFFGRFHFAEPAVPPLTLPRFYRLNFSPTAAFTAGTVAYARVTMGRPDQSNKNSAKNFVVAG